MRRHIYRWSYGELISIAAHLVLLGYIVHLLIANYDTQTELRASMGTRLLRGMEQQTEGLGFFFSEHMRDVTRLVHSHEVLLYFENQALGMSAEYGLNAALTQTHEVLCKAATAHATHSEKHVDKLLLLNHRGQVLTASDDSLIQDGLFDWRFLLQKETSILWEPTRLKNYIILTAPIFLKETYTGQLVTLVPHADIFDTLIYNSDRSTNQNEGLFLGQRIIHAEAQTPEILERMQKTPMEGSESTYTISHGIIICQAMIPGTPFRFVSATPESTFFGPSTPAMQLIGIGGIVTAILFTLIGIVGRHEKHRMLSAITESEERLSYTLQATNDAIWDWDLQENISYYSPRWYDMLGFTEEAFRAQFPNWTDALHPEDRLRAEEALHTHLVGETPFFDAEYRCQAQDGTWLWIMARGKVVEVDKHNKPLRIVGTYANITSRKEAEQMLEETNRTLEERVKDRTAMLLQSEKMASVGQLAAGIAHEINNPSGFVSGNLNTLREYVRDLMNLIHIYNTVINSRIIKIPDKVREKIENHLLEIGFDFIHDDIGNLINESIEGMSRISRIVADLKDFSHVDREDTYSDTDINQMIDKTVNVAWNELKYNCELKKEYSSLPPVPCNSGKISQVILNLLVNAAQAMEGHGIITINTSAWGNVATITISDTGPGIPEDIQNKIFDPFFTTKPVGKGTGLGLHICQKIVTSHGGTISLMCPPEGGSVFTVTLPLIRVSSTETGSEATHNPLPQTEASDTQNDNELMPEDV